MIVKKQTQFAKHQMAVTIYLKNTYGGESPNGAKKQTQFIPQGSKPISKVGLRSWGQIAQFPYLSLG
jgi:hypothetical protein